MIDALDSRETVAYAGVRARNKRHQVSVDALAYNTPTVKTYNMIRVTLART
jgi:hypothetical protein